jgi:hypothetical protein
MRRATVPAMPAAPEYVIGLDRFEQYVFRTKLDSERSEAGDLDRIVYSLRKWRCAETQRSCSSSYKPWTTWLEEPPARRLFAVN